MTIALIINAALLAILILWCARRRAAEQWVAEIWMHQGGHLPEELGGDWRPRGWSVASWSGNGESDPFTQTRYDSRNAAIDDVGRLRDIQHRPVRYRIRQIR